jgi:acetyl-CoA acetyltransferase
VSERFERRVIVSGIGQSAVARRVDRDPLLLTTDACLAAIADAGLTPADIDGLSSYPGSSMPGPGFSGASVREIHDQLGLHPAWVSGGVEAPGQAGAIVNAMLAVAGGIANHVLCWRSIWEGSAQGKGGRKGYGAGRRHVSTMQAWQLPFGATAPALAGLQIQARMHRYGLTREQLAAVPIASRAHAALNPNAVYRDPLTLDDYLGARMISTPLCLFDCDAPCDGATAFVISRVEHAPALDHEAVGVAAVSCRHDDRYIWEYGQDITRITSRWASDVWERTTLAPSDVDVAELYDGFSIVTHCWLEDLGFCGVGEAGAFVEGGARIALDGELPLNTNGGQLSGGRLHGFGQLHEACVQLRGEGGARQVPGTPEVAAVGVGANNSGTTAMLVTRGVND